MNFYPLFSNFSTPTFSSPITQMQANHYYSLSPYFSMLLKQNYYQNKSLTKNNSHVAFEDFNYKKYEYKSSLV